MLNVHQLNVFLIAAETLNFTQAAQRLKMTQPSVSQHIQSLEQHFGTDLFIRSGRSLELTEAGQTLIQMARELVYLSNHIEEKMASLQGDVYGHLIVGCSTTIGRYLLPRLLAAFHGEYPQVRTTCHVASQTQAIQMLCDGYVHLAMTSRPEYCKEVEFRKFITDQILLIAPLDHSWSDEKRISPQDLYEADFILPDEGSEIHFAAKEALNALGISIYQMKSFLTLGSSEAIGLSVKEGLGVGFVSKIIVDKLVHEQVKIIPVDGLEIYQDIYLGRSVNRPPTSAQNAFWDFVFDMENAIYQEFYINTNSSYENLVAEFSSEG